MMQSGQIYYKRKPTREVAIGKIPLGGSNPIRIQTMTNTSTKDIEGSVAQCIKAFDTGADYVRITVPSLNDVEAIASIKTNLLEAGYEKPIIADVHFKPAIAEQVASMVEKVRINPGNFVDRKDFDTLTYSDDEYQAELRKIEEKVTALIDICKHFNTAIRIGVNHGSLSDRIMSRYGDTPMGMAESAMEFVRIISKTGFHDIVISMKSSNTRVMVHATRLVVELMEKEHYSYPIHLGVTEAGEGEDGRIKSSVGISTLLAEGIGDTIRVSLTEDPEFEIPVAQKLANHFIGWDKIPVPVFTDKNYINPFEYRKRITNEINSFIGGNHVPVVFADMSMNSELCQIHLDQLGWSLTNTNNLSGISPDLVFTKEINSKLHVPENKGIILDYTCYRKLDINHKNIFPLISRQELGEIHSLPDKPKFLLLQIADITDDLLKLIKKDQMIILVMESDQKTGLLEHKNIFNLLLEHGIQAPVIIRKQYNLNHVEDFQIAASADTGGLFIDGLGDGIWLNNTDSAISQQQVLSASFGILQAARVRTSRTEYISCPGCGRTLFDLQSTVKKIREKTSHLKGLKIGVMGCIVNGPGEMADADYGYVGTGRGKVNLYKGQTCIQKDIIEEQAVEALIQLIRDNGDWVEF
jgi:(E)-4-hydroxy-3-methylbut-2-enyl-diphosphate synthase